MEIPLFGGIQLGFVFRWDYPKFLFEDFGKVARLTKTGLVSNFSNGELRVF